MASKFCDALALLQAPSAVNGSAPAPKKICTEPAKKDFFDGCKDFMAGATTGCKDVMAKRSQLVDQLTDLAKSAEADPQTVRDIKAVLPDVSEGEIKAALKYNNFDKVAATKALVGAGAKPQATYRDVQYNVPSHPHGEYSHPQPMGIAAGGDRPRRLPNSFDFGEVKEDKSWWDEHTEQFQFKSGLVLGGLAGAATILILPF
jgi:hypothetical protein